MLSTRAFLTRQLREIEIIIGARLESAEAEMTEPERETLVQMQQILYATDVSLLIRSLYLMVLVW